MLLGRPRSYRDIWIGLALALPVLVAIWFIAGAVPASGLAVVAVIGPRPLRHAATDRALRALHREQLRAGSQRRACSPLVPPWTSPAVTAMVIA
jgi:hypothetical protein